MSNPNNLNMFSSGYSIELYKVLEDDFITFISYVPLDEGHLRVHSPKLADLIIRCCIQIDIFFKEWLKLSNLDHIDDISNYRQKRQNIDLYRDFFEPRLHLSKFTICVKDLEDPISPFENFSEISKAPCWWAAHNNLKHDAYKSRKYATLDNALNAISALYFLHRANFITTYALRSSLENRRILWATSFPPDLERLDE